MICPTVRRVTAAVALASALWLASPAAAIPRTHRPPRERSVPQARVLDQFLQWLENVWAFSLPGARTEESTAARKSILQPGGSGTATMTSGSSTNSEQGIAIDPNGKD